MAIRKTMHRLVLGLGVIGSMVAGQCKVAEASSP
jgi:hypothetical protein